VSVRQWQLWLVLLIVALTVTSHGAGSSVLRAQGGVAASVVPQSPMAGAANVSTRTTVRATFSEPVQEASIAFELRDASGNLVAAAATYDAESTTATLTPSADLAGSASYTARVTAATDLEGNPLASPHAWSFTTAAPQFIERVVFSGLTNPTAIEFATDGRVFVAEKSGIIKVFDDVNDSTPTVFADLRTNVHNFWDRGLLGMALHPDFPTVPFIYVLYSHDAPIGGSAPRWGVAGPRPIRARRHLVRPTMAVRSADDCRGFRPAVTSCSGPSRC
jgi:hypothetical protein